MVVRLHVPGVFSSASVGRVFVIHYRVMTTLAVEQQVRKDYEAHAEQLGGRTPILACNQAPLLPLPAIEVRAFWREALTTGTGVEGFAVIGRGVGGLAAAAMTNLLEHMIDPRLGTRFRVFSSATSAIRWLANFELEASPEEIEAGLGALVELD